MMQRIVVRLCWVVGLIGLAGCASPGGSADSGWARPGRSVNSAAMAYERPEGSAGAVTTQPAGAGAVADGVAEPAADGLAGLPQLSLERARQIALQSNPDLYAARARIEAAFATVKEARAAFFPEVAVSHKWDRTFHTPNRLARFPTSLLQDVPLPDLPANPTLVDILNALRGPIFGRQRRTTLDISNSNSFSANSTTLAMTWTLFDGFVRDAKLLAARHACQATAAGLADAERLIVRAVEAAYYQSQLGLEQLRIAEADEAFSREQLGRAEAMFEARKISKAGVLNFEVRMRAAQANVVAARTGVQVGRIVLAELMGLPESAWPADLSIEPVGWESDAELASADEAGWLATATAQRPDLAQTVQVVKAREALVRAAGGTYSPELSFGGAWGYERISDISYSNDDQASAAGLEFRWILSAGGLRTAQIRQAKADLWEARESLRARRLQVCSEVRQAVAALSNAQEQVRLYRHNLAAAAENRRIVAAEHEAGKASLVRLNEAQRDWVQTEGELARSRVQLRQAWSDLRAAAAVPALPQSGATSTTAPAVELEGAYQNLSSGPASMPPESDAVDLPAGTSPALDPTADPP